MHMKPHFHIFSQFGANCVFQPPFWGHACIVDTEVEYLGGDNPAAYLKIASDSAEAETLYEAFKELLQDISVIHFLGKTPADFEKAA